jgi:hypothetical protein
VKKQTIYIDTSVIGGCFDQEFAEWSNRLIEDFRNNIYIPVLSDVTAAEVEEASENIVNKYTELIGLNSIFLEIDEKTIQLAEEYQNRKILTKNFFDDGLHIAIATINNIDILVSWNFKHIVHFDKIRLFNSINTELGYKPLGIFSPREVATVEDD